MSSVDSVIGGGLLLDGLLGHLYRMDEWKVSWGRYGWIGLEAEWTGGWVVGWYWGV